MKSISIKVSDEAFEFYSENEQRVMEILSSALNLQMENDKMDKLEFVRVICRAKAPVCNWHDMELQIMKGSL